MGKTISPKLPKAKTEKPNPTTKSGQPSSVSSLQRFEKSMVIDYEKWHDGIGYDIDAIRLASPSDRKAIEQMLIQHSPRDWRDIEALAEINTKTAQDAIKNAVKNPNPDVRVAVTRFAPNLVTNRERSQSIIEALQHAEVFGGLSQVLDDRDLSSKGRQGSTYEGIIKPERRCRGPFCSYALLCVWRGKRAIRHAATPLLPAI